MDITLEFCGGAETHANGEKFILLNLKSDPGEMTVRDIFRKIRKENVSSRSTLSARANVFQFR